jgi:hypothetical protein
MSKGSFTERYRAQGEIFALTDPKATISVIVSDEGVPADENGKKTVLAGTIVGGIGGPVLKDSSLMVAKHGPATFTTVLPGDNNDLLFVAQTSGVTTVTYVDPGAPSTPISAAAVGTDVTVTLETNANSDIISTANDVLNVINSTGAVAAVVTASNIAGEAGIGVVAPMAVVTLVSNGSVVEAEGVLVNDVDVTHGPEGAAMAIHGFIEVSRIPVPPTPAQETTMKLLQFIAYRH